MKYIVVIILFFNLTAQGQKKQKKWSLDGYVSYMNSNSFDSIQNPWVIDNQFYNRLNFDYYINKNITFTAQLRNRLIYGNSMLLVPTYSDIIGKDNGWADLSFNAVDEKNLVVNFYFDRLNLLYSKDNLEIQLGRQRVNWGRTLVWNPNDFFNSYSYFDFNYEEKPGSDAIRVNYYTGATSSIEFAAKVDHNKNATLAAKWLFNKWNYDIQLVAGEMNQKDYIAGIGWAGNIWQLGFKGETSYFLPIETSKQKDNAVLSATVSLDYSFGNSLYIMLQGLYTTIPKNSPIQDFTSYYYAQLNAKYLSFTEWNFFAQTSYPITPLLTGSLAGMYYPDLGGFFVNPMLSYSLSDNVAASIVWQYFQGDFPNPVTGLVEKQQVNMVFMTFKWNF